MAFCMEPVFPICLSTAKKTICSSDQVPDGFMILIVSTPIAFVLLCLAMVPAVSGIWGIVLVALAF